MKLKEKFTKKNISKTISWFQLIGIGMVLILAEFAPIVQIHFALVWGTVWFLVGLVGLIEGLAERDMRRRCLNVFELVLAFVLLYIGYVGPYLIEEGGYAWDIIISEKLVFFEPFCLYHFTFLVVMGLELVQIIVPRKESPEEAEKPMPEKEEKGDGEEGKRPCPNCGVSISVKVKKCPYCEEELGKEWGEKE